MIDLSIIERLEDGIQLGVWERLRLSHHNTCRSDSLSGYRHWHPQEQRWLPKRCWFGCARISLARACCSAGKQFHEAKECYGTSYFSSELQQWAHAHVKPQLQSKRIKART